MSKRANTTLIGAFVVGAVTLAVAIVLVLAGGQLFTEQNQYVMYFKGSVKGLTVGAPVNFRGVKVGTVTDIQLVVDTQELAFHIPVTVEIETDRYTEGGDGTKKLKPLTLNALIERGLRAQLQLQSLLTGQLFIQLDFHPDTPAEFVGNKTLQEIPTIATPIEKLGKELQDFPIEKVLADVSSTLDGINDLVNLPELKQSIRSLREALDAVKNLAGNINNRIEPLASNVNITLDEARNALQQARGSLETIGPLTSNFNSTLDEARNALRQARSSLETIRPLTSSFNATLDEARSTLKSMDNLISDEQILTELENTLREITAAAQSIRVLADSIDRQPESLIKGRR